MSLTDAEKKRAQRKRDKKAGLVRVEVKIRPGIEYLLKYENGKAIYTRYR